MAREALWALAIVAGALAPATAVLCAGRSFVWRDSATLFEPTRPVIAAALRRFELPLWDPYEAFGIPLLGQLLHGCLHPVSVLAAWLLPGSGVNAMLMAYLGLAALGAAVLARACGATRGAAATAGFAYGLSGYVLSMTSVMTYLAAGGTAPWTLAGLVLAARGGARAVAVAALGVCALHLAGDPQWTAVAAGLGLLLAAEARGARGALRALAGIALGSLLGAVQLVPSWAYLAQSVRASGISAGDRAQWALAPARLLELVAPGFFGGRPGVESPAPVFLWLGGPTQYKLAIPFVASVFVGAAVLALAVVGGRARRSGRALAIASLVLLWLALGIHAGADQALRWIPVWGSFRYSEKLVGPLTLCLALLAAGGVDRLAAGAPRRLGGWLLAAGSIAGLLALTLAVLPRPHETALGAGPAALGVAQASLALGLFHAAVGLAALGALVLAARRGWARDRFPPLAAGLVLLTSIAASPYALHVGRDDLGAPPLVLSARSDASFLRYATPLETPPFPNPLHLDSAEMEVWFLSRLGTAPFNVPWKLDQVSVYSGVSPRTLSELGGRFGPDLWSALRRFGLTHVVVRAPATAAEEELARAAVAHGELLHADDASRITIWSVPHRPWAYFAEQAVSVSSEAEALDALVSYDLAGMPTAVVQGAVPRSLAPGRLLHVERGLDRTRIEADAAGGALLVVNDAFWPGWRATIDGVDVELLRVNYLVRGVAWPAGRHVLEMRYDPPEVKLGLALSLAGAVVLLALALSTRLARQRRVGAVGQPPR